jgi:hypothetical protein
MSFFGYDTEGVVEWHDGYVSAANVFRAGKVNDDGRQNVV